MTKREFISVLSNKMNKSKIETSDIIETFLDTIEETLISGEHVQLTGWGTFEVKDTKARLGRNPKTGVEVHIPPRKSIKFRPGQKFAERVNI